MTVKAEYQSFDNVGKPTGGGQMFLPDYLDWLPIEVKVFWFLHRGYGEPEAVHVLFISQGERRLVTIETPLQLCDLKTLQEKDNGIEEHVNRFISEKGYSRKPRNQ